MRTRTVLAATLSAAVLGLPVAEAPAVTEAPAVAEAPPDEGSRPCRTKERTSIPLSADAPIGNASCAGVRPGALVRTRLGSCTLNFVFRGNDGGRYIGTAGHCILEENGRRIWRPGRGPVVRDEAGRPFGRFSFAVLNQRRDFALIRIRRGVTVRARICYWGGPTRGDRGTPSSGALLRHFGQGVGIGSVPVGNTPVVPARTAIVRTTTPHTIYGDGVAIFGDSGSAVIQADGTARGVLVTLQAIPSRGLIGITRLRPQVRVAQRALGLRLRLQTARLRG